jgi:hypothetical protein
VNRVLNHVYEVKFVASDYLTDRPHEFITDPVEIEAYKKRLAERDESYDPALRPRLVIIDRGTWKDGKWDR